MISIAICDDNKQVCESLKLQINSIDKTINTIIFNSGFSLYQYLQGNNSNLDAIFMDIEFSDTNVNGISLSHEITKKYPNIKIIFVTGYSEKYIEDIFISNHKINPYGFLKKPIDIIKLSTYINQLKDVAIPQKKDSLAFKVVKDGITYVPLNDILYISSNKRLVTIHTLKNEYTGYNKLSSIMKDLQECSNNFYQCHKSFIVNILAISSIHQSSIIIHGNTIPLSDLHGKSVAKKREDIMRLKDILRNKGE